jgi:membrane-associated phospholipid phosphatase
MKALLYDWNGLNVRLFHVINDVHRPWLDALMLRLTQLGDHDYFAIYLAVGVLGGWFSTARKRTGDAQAWLTTLAVFSAGCMLDGVLIGLFKTWVDFPRPLLALPPGSVHVVGQAEFHHSLPSGHAAFAMLVAASFWPQANRLLRIGLVLFALAVGISRVSLGAHFPADVAAGFMLGLLTVLLLRTIAQRFSMR